MYYVCSVSANPTHKTTVTLPCAFTCRSMSGRGGVPTARTGVEAVEDPTLDPEAAAGTKMRRVQVVKGKRKEKGHTGSDNRNS